MPNYSFVIDSSFRPFSMQEMLVPLTAYKEAYEQSEEKYADLKTKADVFKDLSNSLPDGSRAKAIYEGYANDLNAYAEDFAQHGLNMGNRSGLTKLKQRYQGEIGLLTEAKTKLEKELDLRRQMSAKDPSMLYALDNADLNIDSFLGGNTPNDYSISGDSLYAKGMAAGQGASKRVYSVGDSGDTIAGYYRDFVTRNGYSAEKMAQFRQNISSIPELAQAADDILAANGVLDNLKGKTLEQARKQVINGIIDGSVYAEQHNPVRNPGVPGWAEEQNAKLGWANHKLAQDRFNEEKIQHRAALRAKGYDENGTYHPEWRPTGYTTALGNPTYFDQNGIRFAYGTTPETKNQKFYDNDGDNSFTDKTPSLDQRGKPTKSKSWKDTMSEATQKEMTNLDNALQGLNKKSGAALKNTDGFSVTYKDATKKPKTTKYTYIGAVANRGNGEWKGGLLGEDVPGRGWGFTSSSNTMNAWGDWAVTGNPDDEEEVYRVLAENEDDSMTNDPNFARAVENVLARYAYERNSLEKPQRYKLVEVPNEDGENRKDYLVAIEE